MTVLTVVGGPIGRNLRSNPVTVSNSQLETTALRAVIIGSTIRLLLDDDRCDFAVSTTDTPRHITQRATHHSGRGVDTQTVPREVVIQHFGGLAGDVVAARREPTVLIGDAEVQVIAVAVVVS